ncbi:MAG: ribose 5-phosphate isomerase B [Lachnospiraceae bacterium]|nr:ribose 5-phosphate isomerase B [Lachnospiraceae bacterium]MEE3460603.1 ribose 5-phosphate isomerase B [Lachnospiraceae bacterium]
MDKVRKVIFVSRSNLFLGPVAETYYRNMSAESGTSMPECVSRGLVVLFPQPVSPKVNVMLTGKVKELCHHEETIQLAQDDIVDGTYIFTTSLSEKVSVIEDYNVKNVYTLGEFSRLNIDIPDPYGKEDSEYEKSSEVLYDTVREIFEKIKAINGGMKMIALGSDHGGFELKEKVKAHLDEQHIPYKDYGCFDTNSCDYPIYAKAVAKAVVGGEADLGILICGTGIGMSMAANKVSGIRAALCHDTFSAEATKLHNNANVLCMGARVIGPGLAMKIVDTFLNTEFSNEERHVRRIDMLE